VGVRKGKIRAYEKGISSAKQKCFSNAPFERTDSFCSVIHESLLSVTVVHGQSLKVLLSLSVVSKSGSHATAAVSGSVYSATVAMFGVSEAGTLVHTLAHGGYEAHGILSGLTLRNEPKPLGQHRPPPPRSILSPGESSYLL
nr:hypothetical protein [Tanacetum cinerariifolium]